MREAVRSARPGWCHRARAGIETYTERKKKKDDTTQDKSSGKRTRPPVDGARDRSNAQVVSPEGRSLCCPSPRQVIVGREQTCEEYGGEP